MTVVTQPGGGCTGKQPCDGQATADTNRQAAQRWLPQRRLSHSLAAAAQVSCPTTADTKRQAARRRLGDGCHAKPAKAAEREALQSSKISR